jgi:hypothetical protein
MSCLDMFFCSKIYSYIFNYDLKSVDSVKFTKSRMFYGPKISPSMFIYLVINSGP